MDQTALGSLANIPATRAAADSRQKVVTNVVDRPGLEALSYDADQPTFVGGSDHEPLQERLAKALAQEERWNFPSMAWQETKAQLAAAAKEAQRAAANRQRLQEQVAAEAAANEAMARAIAMRKKREEMAARGLEDATSPSPAPSPAPAPAAPKKRAGLKNLLRSRGARNRSRVAAVQKESAAKVADVAPKTSSKSSLEQLPEVKLAPAPDANCNLTKPIFVISDCTGESAANTVRSALGQFEQCIDQSCPTNLVIFRFVNKEREVYDIFEKAAEEDALVVTSLVANRMMRAVRVASKVTKVTTVDLWSGLLDHMEEHLEMARSGIPLGRRKQSKTLSAEYFRMIEAVEFTRKHDDGAMPESWPEADILLLGVSRTGKTPLSIYLGQRGYKCANLPLVPINGKFHLPKQLFEIDQNKVIGLLIDPELLLTIRSQRMDAMGVERSAGLARETYDSILRCREEVTAAKDLYADNGWPVLDVTDRAVEETAARILRLLSDRDGPYHPIQVEGVKQAGNASQKPTDSVESRAAADIGNPAAVKGTSFGGKNMV